MSEPRQAVVFVRLNNMDTFEVEHQRTLVIDLDEDAFWDTTYGTAVQAALEKAAAMVREAR